MIFQKGGENIFFTRKYTLPFAIYCTIEHKEENGGSLEAGGGDGGFYFSHYIEISVESPGEICGKERHVDIDSSQIRK